MLFFIVTIIATAFTLNVHYLFVDKINKSYKLYETTTILDTIIIIKSQPIKKVILQQVFDIDRFIMRNDTILIIYDKVINNYYK